MIPEKLKNRLKPIKGRATNPKPDPIQAGRRGKNYIEMEEVEEVVDFFEYEKELSELTSSRELTLKSSIDEIETNFEENLSDNSNSNYNEYIIMEEETSVDNNKSLPSYVILENEDVIDDGKKKKYNDVVGFEFVYCTYIKKDGNRCRRQAPKDKEYCSTHQKMLNAS